MFLYGSKIVAKRTHQLSSRSACIESDNWQAALKSLESYTCEGMKEWENPFIIKGDDKKKYFLII